MSNVRSSLVALLFACTALAAQQAEHAASPWQLNTRQLRAEADTITALLHSALEQHGRSPMPRIDDATFVRRAYLGVVGRIPNLRETRAFLDEEGDDKRSSLVDTLLLAKGHASHSFHFWADLLRAKTRLAPQTSGAPYLEWIRNALDDNQPYDTMVHELLTADGAAHAAGNGATGYYLRDRGMPEDNMANTARLFLGTRLECAQCHNHPFDKWTQKQFFEMAAFTGGMRFRQDLRGTETRKRFQKINRKVREAHGKDGQRALRRMLRPIVNGISGTGTGLTKLPEDYQYEDGEPGQAMTAKPLFGDAPPVEVRKPRNRREARQFERRQPEVGSRQTYANWLTSPGNPRFTRVIANRMWKRVFGLGLIEPVDDLKDDTVASNPELMRRLEDLMVRLDYDLREFERVLRNTDLFDREVAVVEQNADHPFDFPGPLLDRMSAEQLWDSMLTFVAHDVDSTIGVDNRAELVGDRYAEVLSLSDADVLREVELQLLRTTDRNEFRRQMRLRRNQQKGQDRRELGRTRSEARPLLRALSRARRQGDLRREEEVLAELEEKGLLDALRRANRKLVRASELPSPAPAGHFLREFGQSDREQFDSASNAATVPQVLELVNGFVERYVLRRRSSPLMQAIARARSPAEKIEAAYLAIYSRRPTADETQLWQQDSGRRARGHLPGDLVWTLVNSHEFRFIR